MAKIPKASAEFDNMWKLLKPHVDEAVKAFHVFDTWGSLQEKRIVQCRNGESRTFPHSYALSVLMNAVFSHTFVTAYKLWENRGGASLPCLCDGMEYCPNINFDRTAISDLRKKINRIWEKIKLARNNGYAHTYKWSEGGFIRFKGEGGNTAMLKEYISSSEELFYLLGKPIGHDRPVEAWCLC